jgi:hypothetical protein
VAADLVVLAATRRGVPLYRYNTEDYPSSIGLSFDPERAEAATLTTRDGDVALGRARGIWLRRPRWPEIAREVADPLDRMFARQEAVAAMGGVWRVLADKCVSAPDAMQAARWKVPQLAVAAALKLPVPATLVTSDPAAARAFVGAGPTVLKAVAQARVQTAAEERVGRTVAIDATFDAEAVRPAPVLLQRRIDKVADIRITAVGPHLFPVRITVPEGAPIDFRETDPGQCGFEVIDLPDGLAAALHRYLQHWPLRFGAFDLAEDRDGQLWFLECNPAGQWGWLEQPTGLDITGAVLDLLLSQVAA